MGVQKCPRCQLVSEADARTCDCGFAFGATARERPTQGAARERRATVLSESWNRRMSLGADVLTLMLVLSMSLFESPDVAGTTLLRRIQWCLSAGLVATMLLALPRPSVVTTGLSALATGIALAVFSLCAWVAAIAVVTGGNLNWANGRTLPGFWGLAVLVGLGLVVQAEKAFVVLVGNMANTFRRRDEARRRTRG